jgi:hypothetical protein
MAVAEVEECLGPICRESSQLEEESKLYSVPAVPIFLLRCGQIGLFDFHEVLNIHRRLLPLLATQAASLRQFSECLQNFH